jgi:hypothetical protein
MGRMSVRRKWLAAWRADEHLAWLPWDNGCGSGPDLGDLSPGRIVSAAEESGVVVEQWRPALARNENALPSERGDATGRRRPAVSQPARRTAAFCVEVPSCMWTADSGLVN